VSDIRQLPALVDQYGNQSHNVARRAANAEIWRNNPRNANVRYREAKSSIQVDVTPSGIESLDELRRIMADTSVAIGRRLRAGAAVLKYELAPGSAIGVDPDNINSSAYRFFLSVSRSTADPEYRQIALEHLVAIDNARARSVDPDEERQQRTATIAAVNTARRMALVQAGAWPAPIEIGAGWMLREDDKFELPQFNEERARTSAHARHDTLLEVAATNRDDTSWRVLIARSGA
jgi:hypothetical protein